MKKIFKGKMMIRYLIASIKKTCRETYWCNGVCLIHVLGNMFDRAAVHTIFIHVLNVLFLFRVYIYTYVYYCFTSI